MAFDNPPFVIDATTIDGEVIRRAIGSLIAPAGGVIAPGDLTVTQNGTPNMSVNIGAGQIWVPGSTTATQGPYYSRNGASINQAINAASASNPRIDTVGAQVQDKAYAGSLTQIAPFYVAGTATAGANLSNLTGKGAVPASSYVLAYVLVPTSATSIITADILNVASSAYLNLEPQNFRITTTNVTANPGDLIDAANGVTVTIAAATATTPQQPITIFSANGTVTVNVGSGVFGGGMAGATSFTLGQGATITLVSTGSAYIVTDGQQDSGFVALSSFGSGVSAGTPAPAYRLRADRIDLRGIAVCASAPSNIVQIPGSIMPVATSPVNRFLPTVYGNSWATVTLAPGTPNWLAAGAGASISSAGSFNLEGVTWPIG